VLQPEGMNPRIPALLACVACTATWAVTTYSESVGISLPGKRIVGMSAGNDRPSGPAALDEQLLNRVVAALVRDPELKDVDIEVRVEEGRVRLDGKAANAQQAEHAREVAQDAAGGAPVANGLAAKD
jgi:osmotically-inducible protein OsmY